MHELPGTLLLDPTVLDNPYTFYRQLRTEAPVWMIPGTAVFTVSTFEFSGRSGGAGGRFLVEYEMPALS